MCGSILPHGPSRPAVARCICVATSDEDSRGSGCSRTYRRNCLCGYRRSCDCRYPQCIVGQLPGSSSHKAAPSYLLLAPPNRISNCAEVVFYHGAALAARYSRSTHLSSCILVRRAHDATFTRSTQGSRVASGDGCTSPQSKVRCRLTMVEIFQNFRPTFHICLYSSHPGRQNAALYALERPLTIEVIERLIRWLVPLRERAAAAGMGRRQVLLIGGFLFLMLSFIAFSEYWHATMTH